MKYGLLAGRFQLPTKAHFANIVYGLEYVDHMFVAIGTAFGPLDDANPFLGHQRRDMLVEGCKELGIPLERVTFLMLDDYPDDQEWAGVLHAMVRSQTRDNEVFLIGMKKDESSFYLDMFPQWQSIECPKYMFGKDTLSSTFFRRRWITGTNWTGTIADEIKRRHLCQSTVEIVDQIASKMPERMKTLREEMAFYDQHDKDWAHSPYPPTFQTGDAATFWKDHILMIRRAKAPGKNRMALPGGYVNRWERIDAAIERERGEETAFKGGVKRIGSFHVDSPRRSRRGRIFTKVGVFVCYDEHQPEVFAGDDAKEAFWLPNNKVDLYKHEMFEDHFDLVTRSIRILKDSVY